MSGVYRHWEVLQLLCVNVLLASFTFPQMLICISSVLVIRSCWNLGKISIPQTSSIVAGLEFEVLLVTDSSVTLKMSQTIDSSHSISFIGILRVALSYLQKWHREWQLPCRRSSWLVYPQLCLLYTPDTDDSEWTSESLIGLRDASQEAVS